ncbi:zincin-like metallopeptidase domain-containing protein [Vibrio crassostreae]|uniref:zincin-like metallopeptidase domain-containing protein n=1 Tax=Vibrio crassostreae TaxID=246167 RepID=UPI001B308F0D|nr:zincin-like metallopeptidase domain-containing protein [Vibrio crassostreae]
MSNVFESAVIMDVLICTFIDGAGGIKEAKSRLKKHLSRAKRTHKADDILGAIKEMIELDSLTNREFAKEAVAKITKNDSVTQGYLDVFELWGALIDKNHHCLREWNKPWIVDASYAEKFKGGKRFIYSGGRNQLNAAIAIAMNKLGGEYSGILVTESKVKEFLSRPAAIEDGDKLDNHPELCFFANPVEEQKQQSGAAGRLGFFSTPVWAIEEFKKYLTKREQKLLDVMLAVRNKEKGEFKPQSEDLLSLVQSKVDWQKEKHGVECRFNKAEAYYNPANDHISMPDYKQFTTELEYYSCWVHELAHSTERVLKRSKRYENLTERSQYAIEEVLAETVSFLAVKRLRSEATSLGLMNEEMEKAFNDCFENSEAYTTSWGNKVKASFVSILDNKYRSHLFGALIKDVFSCHMTISTGTVQGKQIER